MGHGKGLLVVSYGTSQTAAAGRTIGVMEQELAATFEGMKFYRAWTSRFMREKVLEKTGAQIDSVEQALQRMQGDGITDVLLQPTHIIEGKEYEAITDALTACCSAEMFRSIRLGQVLLKTVDDISAVSQAISGIFGPVAPDEAVVLAGHGTQVKANALYRALSEELAAYTDGRILLGLVEAEPGIGDVLAQLAALQPEPVRIRLAPFLLTAGVHASRDLLRDDPGSWKGMLEAAGFAVSGVMKGLGEYPQIRAICLQHAREAQVFEGHG